MEQSQPLMLKCSKCLEVLSAENFYIFKKTGKPKGPCKLCQKSRARDAYAKDPAKYQEKSKAWYYTNHTEALETAARYRDMHREQINENARIYWNLNSEEFNVNRRKLGLQCPKPRGSLLH